MPLLSKEEQCAPLSRKDECVGEQRRCLRQRCLFVCLPSGAKFTLGALQPGNKQSFVSTDPLCPAARLQASTPVLIGNHRRRVCSSRGRGAFSHPPVLSSSPIKTATARQRYVVLWWPLNQKCVHQHPLGTNTQHNTFGISQLVIYFVA